MAESRLEMTFKNQLDNRVRLSVDNPRPDLTTAEVRTVMEDIIARNVFDSSGGDLVSLVGARVITTDINELTL